MKTGMDRRNLLAFFPQETVYSSGWIANCLRKSYIPVEYRECEVPSVHSNFNSINKIEMLELCDCLISVVSTPMSSAFLSI